MVGGPADRLRALIQTRGPIPWSVVIQEALYGPAGFYTLGGGAGRGRDFLTSPEVGPLFGAVVARAVDHEWTHRGRPDPWVVVEAGAGAGALAAAVLDAGPACVEALSYIAVEVSAPLRDAAAARLGSRAVVTELMAAGPFTGMILANELLDNLAFDVFARTASGWDEIRVGPGLVEVSVPGPSEVAAELDRLAPAARVGVRVPRQTAARVWLRRALDSVETGRVVVIDYARSTAELAAAGQGGWMRTYRRGGPGGLALEDLGAQDITTDVAVDQLALVSPPTRIWTQAEWLDGHGMADLERDAAAAWRAGRSSVDLAALRARSRVNEAAALRDPAGLGSFTVLEWSKDASTTTNPADL